MNEVWVYALLSVFIVSLISFIGVFTLGVQVKKLRTILVYLISFSAGALLGDAFLHLLPEIVESQGFSLEVSFSVLGGIVLFFVLEKVIHWRHCHMPVDKGHVHSFAHMNLIGDGFHNLLDGLIIGASYLVSLPVGIATTIAVALHEIPQEIGDFGVLVHAGFSRVKALVLNFASGLVAVFGVLIALFLGGSVEGIEKFLVPIAAGGFIYIAGSDLIPEMHKDTEFKRSLLQVASFILGILVMAVLLLVE